MTGTVRRVEMSSLMLGPVLGTGGQGRVNAVSGFLIDGHSQAVMKTYTSAVSVDYQVLEQIVAFPDQLHPNDRDWLLGISSWPWAIVMDNGVQRGFLMREVPGVFKFSFATVTRGVQARLSNVEYLLNPDDYVSGKASRSVRRTASTCSARWLRPCPGCMLWGLSSATCHPRTCCST